VLEFLVRENTIDIINRKYMAREIITDDGDRVVVEDTTYVSYYSPFANLLWTILGILNGILAIRFLLKLFGANPAAGFANFIYTITNPLVRPFVGVVRSTFVGTGIAEWHTIVAMIVYWLIVWAIVRLVTVSRAIPKF
jgi:hypothetical protein